MYVDCKAYCQTCDHCQRNKASTQKPYGLLRPLKIPDKRWECVTMDYITDLPMSNEGNTAVLIFVDKLTKYVHIAPCLKTCTAEEAARLFVKHVFQYHGLPKSFVSDRDTRFTSDFFREFTRISGVSHHFTTAYHPEGDGQTERMNRVVEEVLRHFIDLQQTNWEELMPMVTFAINNSVCESTGHTPFFLNTGQHPTTFNTIFTPTDRLPTLDVVLQDIDVTMSSVKKLLQAAQGRNSYYANNNRRDHNFNQGDEVLLSTKNIKFKVGTKKLHPKFIGPFKIKRMIGSKREEVAAELILPLSYRIHPVFHVSLLRPYKSGLSFVPLPPNPEIVDGIPYYEVECILSHRDKKAARKGKLCREFLIKWKGYSDIHNSWEPEKNITQLALDEYNEKLKPVLEPVAKKPRTSAKKQVKFNKVN